MLLPLPEASIYGRRVDAFGGRQVPTLKVEHKRFKLEQDAAPFFTPEPADTIVVRYINKLFML
jgi:hypothetical protein